MSTLTDNITRNRKEIRIHVEAMNLAIKVENGWGPGGGPGPVAHFEFWGKEPGGMQITKYVFPVPYMTAKKTSYLLMELLAKVELAAQKKLVIT